ADYGTVNEERGSESSGFTEGYGVVFHVHENVAAGLVLREKTFATVDGECSRAATAHRGGPEATLLQRWDDGDEHTKLGRVGHRALGKVNDMLDFAGIGLKPFP